MLTRGSVDSLSRIRVSLSHSPPSLVTARLTAMAAAPVGAVVAGARGGVLVRGGCGVVAVMEARTMLQRLRFISGVVVFAATADGGGTGVCWMRLRLVVASEDGAEKTEAARCCCGGDGCASLQVRRREDVCAAGSWWSRTKMVVRELAEKIT